jgi:hypothetical protein
VVWLGSLPAVKYYVKKGKNNLVHKAVLTLHNKKDAFIVGGRCRLAFAPSYQASLNCMREIPGK